MATPSVNKRASPAPCLDRVAFLSTLHWGWSSLTMHKFALGDYLLQKTKERMLLITSKKKDISKCKGKMVELVTLVLGRFSINFKNLL